MDKPSNLTQMKLEKRFGQSPVFVASTLLENGGVPLGISPASLLNEAIQVISCGYEDKTEWGKEVMANDCFLFLKKYCLSNYYISSFFFVLLFWVIITRLAGYMVR